MLWKNADGKYFTPAEYEELVKANQTDKHQTRRASSTWTTPSPNSRPSKPRRAKATTCC